MSTAQRKILFIDGNPVETKDDIEVEKGGLEGEEVMSSTSYAGMSFKPMPGRVAAKVIYNASLDKDLWSPTQLRTILVEYADIGQATAFEGMQQKVHFKVDGDVVSIEFVGPAGQDVE